MMIETNVKLSYNNFKLFIGYTLADVNQEQNNVKSTFPLVAKHRLNNVLVYEVEEKLKIGLEAYYFSKQQFFFINNVSCCHIRCLFSRMPF